MLSISPTRSRIRPGRAAPGLCPLSLILSGRQPEVPPPRSELAPAGRAASTHTPHPPRTMARTRFLCGRRPRSAPAKRIRTGGSAASTRFRGGPLRRALGLEREAGSWDANPVLRFILPNLKLYSGVLRKTHALCRLCLTGSSKGMVIRLVFHH